MRVSGPGDPEVSKAGVAQLTPCGPWRFPVVKK